MPLDNQLLQMINDSVREIRQEQREQRQEQQEQSQKLSEVVNKLDFMDSRLNSQSQRIKLVEEEQARNSVERKSTAKWVKVIVSGIITIAMGIWAVLTYFVDKLGGKP